MNINLIVAVDRKTGGIGKDGTMPWKNKDDMVWFKLRTVGSGNNGVVMGNKTYKSLGRPFLKDRFNFVLSRTETESKYTDNIKYCTSLDIAIENAKEMGLQNLFIIGGAQVYKEAIERNLVDCIYIDYLETGLNVHDFDTFFNINILKEEYGWIKSDISTYPKTETTEPVVYFKYNTNNNIDEQYLKLMRDVLDNGVRKASRAGDTISVFGRMLDFDVSKSIACLTTKKMYTKGCITELLWFLEGDTNIKYLIDNGCNIWNDDAYRFFLENYGYRYDERLTKEQFLNGVKLQNMIYDINPEAKTPKLYTYGDLGPVYGKQWTKWLKQDGTFVNQIDILINKLKENPNDRRLIVSAWNVGELDQMALPPCHYNVQFYTTEMSHDERISYAMKKLGGSDNMSDEELDSINCPKYKLSACWSQRSVDVCLGLPYDMLSYSMLLYMIAQCVNMVPDRLKCFLGDCHIYCNQISGAYEQLERNPFKYEHPNLLLNPNIKGIYQFEHNDITLLNYKDNHYGTIKFPLSVGLK